MIQYIKNMNDLFEQSQLLINQTKTPFRRGLYHQINWDCRLIEINGARGVGKTTLMLQRAKEMARSNPGDVLYISLDDPFFYNNNIIELADYFFKFGGKYLFVDEVHKYPANYPGQDWSTELKIIYDRYPDLYVTYSGSSVLQLYKGHGDLSRRKCRYNLPGLSFREYLAWQKHINIPPLTLSQILNDHQSIAPEITEKVKILPLFSDYLKHGYYPYFHEAPEHFCSRLRDTINVILEQDIPAVASFSHENHIKLKKLLAVLSESAPFTPNLTNLRSELFIADQRTLMNYLKALEKAELLNTLEKESHGMKKIQKPSKIYLNNTNLMYCLYQDKPNTGTLRETFFLNQIKVKHKVNYPASGDFLLDSTYTFEVGGKSKTHKQISHTENSYLAIDNTEQGFGNKIPLWLFGFLT